MGSGTGGVVCVEGGWGYIGMELEQDHYTIAERRILSAERPTPAPVQAALEGVA